MTRTILLGTLLLACCHISYSQNTDAAKAKATASCEAQKKKYAAQFDVVKDTIVQLDSTESCEVAMDFAMNTDYKIIAVLPNEGSLTLQLEDATVGAEIYSPGVKDAGGCMVAEGALNISADSSESIRLITIGGGIGTPVRLLVMKKRK
jgi:hypothetical protein